MAQGERPSYEIGGLTERSTVLSCSAAVPMKTSHNAEASSTVRQLVDPTRSGYRDAKSVMAQRGAPNAQERSPRSAPPSSLQIPYAAAAALTAANTPSRITTAPDT